MYSIFSDFKPDFPVVKLISWKTSEQWVVTVRHIWANMYLISSLTWSWDTARMLNLCDSQATSHPKQSKVRSPWGRETNTTKKKQQHGNQKSFHSSNEANFHWTLAGARMCFVMFHEIKPEESWEVLLLWSGRVWSPVANQSDCDFRITVLFRLHDLLLCNNRWTM